MNRCLNKITFRTKSSIPPPVTAVKEQETVASLTSRSQSISDTLSTSPGSSNFITRSKPNFVTPPTPVTPTQATDIESDSSTSISSVSGGSGKSESTSL